MVSGKDPGRRENKRTRKDGAEGKGKGWRGWQRGDTLISGKIYKPFPRVPRIVRPSPTYYVDIPNIANGLI